MYLVVVEPYGPLFRYLPAARRKGYRTLVLARDAGATRREEAAQQASVTPRPSCIDELVECDVGRAAAVVGALEPYRGTIAGLVAGTETAVAVTLEAAAALGLPGPSAADARCQQVKSAMKPRLVDRGVPTPRFRLVRSLPEAQEAWEAFGRDCMVKMVDFRSSANVSRVTDRRGLQQAWRAIETNELDLQVPYPLAREAIVEEFVAGRELSVEGYVGDDGPVVVNLCEKATSSRFLVVDHFLPAQVTSAEREAVADVCARCVRALGIRDTVFHIEITLVDGRPIVIESASRPPGSGEILDMIAWARGADLIDVGIDLATGQRPATAGPGDGRHYALLAVYAEQTGRLTGLEGLLELRRRGGVRRWQLAPRLGDRVEAMTDFRHQYGVLVLEAATAEQLRADVAWARSHLRLLVDDDGAAAAPLAAAG